MFPRKEKTCQFTFPTQPLPVVFTRAHIWTVTFIYLQTILLFLSFLYFHEVLCISVFNITVPDFPHKRGIWDRLYLRRAETSMNVHHGGSCWKAARCAADKSSFYAMCMDTPELTLHRNWLMNTSRWPHLTVTTPLHQSWICSSTPQWLTATSLSQFCNLTQQITSFQSAGHAMHKVQENKQLLEEMHLSDSWGTTSQLSKFMMQWKWVVGFHTRICTAIFRYSSWLQQLCEGNHNT